MSIPKIIHQLWIGTKPRPSNFMNTWKEKNPEFEYILWNEEEFIKRNISFECQDKIDSMEEINGKADIMRWEILWRYGGVFLDADSVCVEPLDDVLMKSAAFASYENEKVREGLIATVAMGFPVNHPLCREAIDLVKQYPVSQRETRQRAWITVGPGMITRILQNHTYPGFKIFPSNYFLPIHFAGCRYYGHDKVYGHQEWGSTRQNYEVMNQIELPNELKKPNEWVSILIPSYNTKTIYIKECLDSIRSQEGHFGMEIVWINDGSNDMNSTLLEKMLQRFEETTRFVKVIYEKRENSGVAKSLHYGLSLCTNEMVFRMDSDDVMFPQRIQKQLDFMKNNPNIPCCGSNVQYLTPNGLGQQTHHSQWITWNDYKQKKSHWIMNHPTLCFRKTDILSIGGYNIETNNMFEDLELELRLLKKYMILYNIPEVLLYYRIHEDQVTYNGKSCTPYWIQKRNQFIEDLVNN